MQIPGKNLKHNSLISLTTADGRRVRGVVVSPRDIVVAVRTDAGTEAYRLADITIDHVDIISQTQERIALAAEKILAFASKGILADESIADILSGFLPLECLHAAEMIYYRGDSASGRAVVLLAVAKLQADPTDSAAAIAAEIDRAIDLTDSQEVAGNLNSIRINFARLGTSAGQSADEGMPKSAEISEFMSGVNALHAEYNINGLIGLISPSTLRLQTTADCIAFAKKLSELKGCKSAIVDILNFLDAERGDNAELQQRSFLKFKIHALQAVGLHDKALAAMEHHQKLYHDPDIQRKIDSLRVTTGSEVKTGHGSDLAEKISLLCAAGSFDKITELLNRFDPSVPDAASQIVKAAKECFTEKSLHPISNLLISKLESVGPAVTDSLKPQYYYALGEAAYLAGLYEKSLETYMRLNELSPSSYTASKIRALSKKLEVSVLSINSVGAETDIMLPGFAPAEKEGTDTDNLELLIKAARRSVAYKQAREECEQLAARLTEMNGSEMDRNLRTTYLQTLGELYYYLGDKAKALELFTELAELNPTDYNSRMMAKLSKTPCENSGSPVTKITREEHVKNGISRKFAQYPTYRTLLYSISRIQELLTRNDICEIPDILYEEIERQFDQLAVKPKPMGRLYDQLVAALSKPGFEQMRKRFVAENIVNLDTRITSIPCDSIKSEEEAAIIIDTIISHRGPTGLKESSIERLRRAAAFVINGFIGGHGRWNEPGALSNFFGNLDRLGLFNMVFDLTEPLLRSDVSNDQLLYHLRYLRAKEILDNPPESAAGQAIAAQAETEVKAAPKLAHQFVQLTSYVGAKIKALNASNILNEKENMSEQHLEQLRPLFDDAMACVNDSTAFFDYIRANNVGTSTLLNFLGTRNRLLLLLEKEGLDTAERVLNFFLNRPNAFGHIKQITASALSNPATGKSATSLINYMMARTSNDRATIMRHLRLAAQGADDALSARIADMMERYKKRGGRYLTPAERLRRDFYSLIIRLQNFSIGFKSWSLVYFRNFDFPFFNINEGNLAIANIEQWLAGMEDNTNIRIRTTAEALRLYMVGESMSRDEALSFYRNVWDLFRQSVSNENIPIGKRLNSQLEIARPKTLKLSIVMAVQIICGRQFARKPDLASILAEASDEERDRAMSWIIECAMLNGQNSVADPETASRTLMNGINEIFDHDRWRLFAGEYTDLNKTFGRNGMIAATRSGKQIAPLLGALRAAYENSHIACSNKAVILDGIDKLLSSTIDDTPGQRRLSREQFERNYISWINEIIANPPCFGATLFWRALVKIRSILDRELNQIVTDSPSPAIRLIEITRSRKLKLEVSLPPAETWGAHLTEIKIEGAGSQGLDIELKPGDTATVTIDNAITADASGLDADVTLHYIIRENGDEPASVSCHIEASAPKSDTPLPNPYRTILTSVASNTAMFYGRNQLIARIMADIDAGNTRLYFGQKRSGKTSVLHKVRELCRDRYATSYVDLSSLSAYVDLRLFYMTLTNAIIDALGPDCGLKKCILDSDYAPGITDPAMIPEFFRRSITDLYNSRPGLPKAVLFLDEFSGILGSIAADLKDPSGSEPLRLANILRSWKSTMSGLPVRFVISSQNDTPTFLKVFGDLTGDFRAVVNEERMSYFEPHEALELISDPLAACDVRIEPNAADALLEATGRSPFYLVIMMSEIVDRLNTLGARVVDLAMVRQLAADLVAGGKLYFDNMYDHSLLTGHRGVREAMQTLLARATEAMRRSGQRSFNPEELIRDTDETSVEAMNQMLERQVIQPLGQSKAYEICVGLFADHLMMQNELSNTGQRTRLTRKKPHRQ